MHAVITYDISCNKSRLQVFCILRELGINSQLSIFECELEAEEIQRLLNRLKEFIDPDTDSLLIYPMCSRCASGVHILGQGLRIIRADWELI